MLFVICETAIARKCLLPKPVAVGGVVVIMLFVGGGYGHFSSGLGHLVYLCASELLLLRRRCSTTSTIILGRAVATAGASNK